MENSLKVKDLIVTLMKFDPELPVCCFTHNWEDFGVAINVSVRETAELQRNFQSAVTPFLKYVEIFCSLDPAG